VAGLTDSLNPFGGGIDFGPQYGHTAEYQNGVTVGHVGGFVMNTVMLVGGVQGTVAGIQTLRSSTGALVQLAQLRLVGGATINAIMVNGEAIVATEAALAQVGINAAPWRQWRPPTSARPTRCRREIRGLAGEIFQEAEN
jgi:hypothetical protein